MKFDLILGALQDPWDTFVTTHGNDDTSKNKGQGETQRWINGNERDYTISKLQLLKAKISKVSKVIQAKSTIKARSTHCFYNHM